jgi:hypothetical protein
MYGKLLASKETIYDYINDYDIFKYYIPRFNKIGQMFTSDLREDKHPTCCINRYNNTLLYADFGTSSIGLDSFGYVQLKYGVKFYEALDIITADFNLPLLLNSPEKPRIKPNYKPVLHKVNIDDIPKCTVSSLRVKVRPFDSRDKHYWFDRYQFTCKDLIHFDVYALEYYVQKGQIIRNKNCTYGYYLGIKEGHELWKCYCPEAKGSDEKWRTNCDSGVLMGLKQLPETGETLFITKALKDVIVLYKLGFDAVSPQAEFQKINSDIIENLRLRFKNIFILYDNDDAGVKASIKAGKDYNLPYILLPEEYGVKDCSDFVEAYDYELLNNVLCQLVK